MQSCDQEAVLALNLRLGGDKKSVTERSVFFVADVQDRLGNSEPINEDGRTVGFELRR